MPSGLLVTLFKAVAILEACSWVGLLTGMYFKHIAESGEATVQVFGPIHGVIFVAYVLLAFAVARVLGWGRRIGLAALVCAVPPFFTLAFEIWAQRTGRLDLPPEPVEAA